MRKKKMSYWESEKDFYFKADTIPREVVYAARVGVDNIIMEELDCNVSNMKEYCAAVKRLGIKIMLEAIKLSYDVFDKNTIYSLKWKESMKNYDERKRKRHFSFYVKNRGAEFYRAAEGHIDGLPKLFPHLMNTQGDVGRLLKGLMSRLYLFTNLDKSVSESTKFIE